MVVKALVFDNGCCASKARRTSCAEEFRDDTATNLVCKSRIGSSRSTMTLSRHRAPIHLAALSRIQRAFRQICCKAQPSKY